MIAIDVLKWPGFNQAFIVSFIAAIVLSLAIIPFGKRRPVGAPTGVRQRSDPPTSSG
jgi:hypothetical protein